jgi:xanthine dehydrogenase small subunit
MRDYVLVYVNGTRHEVRGSSALMMAADWLRREVGLVGTKIVCAEGDCGACTILRAQPLAGSTKVPEFISINSCIATVAHLDCSSIVTVEGMQNDEVLSPVQSAMRDCHASQCGYCTPGFVMAMSGLFEKCDSTDSRTAANYLTGNLCRCTGYAPIIEAAVSVKQKPEFRASTRYMSDVILDDLRLHQKKTLSLKLKGGQEYHAPTRLEAACKQKSNQPSSRVIGAATDLGVLANKGKDLPALLVSLRNISKLNGVTFEGDQVWIGANTSLGDLRRKLAKRLPEFSRFIDIFASPQIKNAATLVGNIANASPIGDTLPFLLVVEADLHLAAWRDDKIFERKLPLNAAFIGYRKLAIAEDELITGVSFVVPGENQMLRIYKASQRKDLDISAVSAAFLIKFDGDTILSFAAAFGGVAATPIRVKPLEEYLTTKPISGVEVEAAVKILHQSIHPLSDVRGSSEYRKLLATNLLRKFFLEVASPDKPSQSNSARRTSRDETLPRGSPHA